MVADFSLGDVRVVDLAPVPVAVLAHRGPPAGIGASVARFIAWRKAAGFGPGVSATYNVLYDDPEVVPPEAFRLDICAGARAVAPNSAGVVAGLIAGGRYAVLRHVGGEEGIGAALRFLHGPWLAQSGESLRDDPAFCQRVAFAPFVPAEEAVTDIFLPLR